MRRSPPQLSALLFNLFDVAVMQPLQSCESHRIEKETCFNVLFASLMKITCGDCIFGEHSVS